jgi:hypothetical protein
MVFQKNFNTAPGSRRLVAKPSFVTNSAPDKVHSVVDFHEQLGQVPLPLWICAHMAAPILADPSSKHKAKSVPAKSNHFVANVHAAFVQTVLHTSKEKREVDVQHHVQADDPRARIEEVEGAVFCHPAKQIARPARLSWYHFDSADFADVTTSVTKVSRVEDMTKKLGFPLLATGSLAALDP